MNIKQNTSCTEKCQICLLPANIPLNWHESLIDEIKKDYFIQIINFLHNEPTFYPPINLTFSFLNFFPVQKTKIVIIGQDPYHNPNEAMGLAFSVPKFIKLPPSLKNIFKELKNSFSDFKIPDSGDLSHWAEQGVLLINTSLTVQKNKPASHKDLWIKFTDHILKCVNENTKNVVYFLWGKHAEKKESLIDKSNNLILKAPHPSPFSANKGFFKSNHFKLANEYLISNNKDPVVWHFNK